MHKIRDKNYDAVCVCECVCIRVCVCVCAKLPPIWHWMGSSPPLIPREGLDVFWWPLGSVTCYITQRFCFFVIRNSAAKPLIPRSAETPHISAAKRRRHHPANLPAKLKPSSKLSQVLSATDIYAHIDFSIFKYSHVLIDICDWVILLFLTLFGGY